MRGIPQDHRVLKSRVIALLAERGPLSTGCIAVDVGAASEVVSNVLRSLERGGAVVMLPRVADPRHRTPRVWAIGKGGASCK